MRWRPSFFARGGYPRPWGGNSELPGLAIEVRPLNAEGLGGVGHAPPVVLKNREDVVALEPHARLTEIASGNERCQLPLELERRQDLLHLNRPIESLRQNAFDGFS